MTDFSNTLKNLRIEYGFDSARRFYENLTNKGEGAFNYPYYVRMEKGSANPSSKVLRALLKHFDKKDQESLINSWCRSHFPEQAYMFGAKATPFSKAGFTENTIKEANELNLKQISILAENKNNYFIFLLATLSRYEVKITDLNQFFSKADIEQTLKRLKVYKLISCNQDTISAQIVERIFPKPSSQKIRKTYELFDLWDSEISERFNFENLITRKFIRRISFRHISLIEKHLNLVFDLIRTADEVEPEHNNHVVQLQLNLSSGELPG